MNHLNFKRDDCFIEFSEYNYLSATVACSFIPILKNTGVMFMSFPLRRGSGNLSNNSCFTGTVTTKQCLKKHKNIILTKLHNQHKI